MGRNRWQRGHSRLACLHSASTGLVCHLKHIVCHDLETSVVPTADALAPAVRDFMGGSWDKPDTIIPKLQLCVAPATSMHV